MKKIGIINVNTWETSNKGIYEDLIDFVVTVLDTANWDSEILENPSQISDHTHIIFIAESMCEIASETQEENPDKKVILLFAGEAVGKTCLENVIPIQKGTAGVVGELLAAIA